MEIDFGKKDKPDEYYKKKFREHDEESFLGIDEIRGNILLIFDLLFDIRRRIKLLEEKKNSKSS